MSRAVPRLVLLGPTAVGKDEVALPLAESLAAEIISVDSIKVYRGMDIGTAKPDAAARARVPHHLLDVVDPWESYSVGRFVDDAEQAAGSIEARGAAVLHVAGSGLYLRALLEGLMPAPPADANVRAYLRARADREGIPALHAELARLDPTAAARIHPHDFKRIGRALEHHRLTGEPISARQTQSGKRRTDCRFLLFGLTRPRSELRERASRRVDSMVAAGLVDEVRRLAAHPRGIAPQAAEAIGYREILAALREGRPLTDAIAEIKVNTGRFLKRQDTWFRRFADTRWFEISDASDPVHIAGAIRACLADSSGQGPFGPLPGSEFDGRPG